MKRYSNKIQSFLTEHGNQLEAERKAQHENMIDNAMQFANKTRVSKARQLREQAIRDIDMKNEYYVSAFNEGMAGVLTKIVVESLPLDSEYEEKNPGYKLDIQDTINGVFRSGNVNNLISDERMLNIINTVSNNTPVYDSEGNNVVKEEAITTMIEAVEKENKDDINSLINNVNDKVIKTLDAEKKQAEEIEKDLDKAIEESAKFIVEKQEKTLFESLCFNNAKYQLQENGDYDSELSVANGILMLTILETLKETGFVADRKHEKNIIEAILG